MLLRWLISKGQFLRPRVLNSVNQWYLQTTESKGMDSVNQTSARVLHIFAEDPKVCGVEDDSTVVGHLWMDKKSQHSCVNDYLGAMLL